MFGINIRTNHRQCEERNNDKCALVQYPLNAEKNIYYNIKLFIFQQLDVRQDPTLPPRPKMSAPALTGPNMA